MELNYLKEQEAKILHDLLKINYQAFSSFLTTKGHSDKFDSQISFDSDYPIKKSPSPFSQSLHEETRKQLNQIIESNILEKNVASWVCPILLVKNKFDETGEQKYGMALDL